ncbi:MAG: biliverdin-producing heme oxygenase [Pyrinomonadaceae bacterium]|jgi:heme oxygenase
MIAKALKEATKEQHEALEQIVNIMDESTDLNSYGNLLLKFYRIYATLEPLIPNDLLLENGFNYKTREKLPHLLKDLKVLGLSSAAENLIRYERVPDMQNAARAFGVLYVIEGSTLGGQVISRHLRDRLGLTPDNGAAFFSSYGHEVGQKWKEFCDALNRFGEIFPEMHSEIIDAAKETFSAFAECFKEQRQISITA